MKTVLLVPILAPVAAHRDKSMMQRVEQRHLVSCVVAVVQRHFAVGRTVQLSSTGGGDNHATSVLEAMHRLELWPVQVTEPSRDSELPSNVEKISSYIILTRSVKDFTVQAEKLFSSTSCDNRGLFLIVVADGVSNSEELALSIVQELWQVGRVYNVVVMVQQDTLLNLYTWFPYSSHDNCGDVKNVVLINQWVMEEAKLVREGSLFPYKIPSNFHGCTMNVSTFVKGRTEDEFYGQFCLTYNITRNYVGDFSKDTTYYERVVTFLTSFCNGESDMLFGALPLVEISNAEPTFPYYIQKVTWFVPCAKHFSRLQRISHIFSLSVWVSVAAVLFLVTAVSWCLAEQSNDIRSYADMSNAMYNIWAVTVVVSVTRTPRNLRLKFLFVVFVWYCSSISTVFQRFLTRFLADPGYENQLQSFEEILDSGIGFGYWHSFQMFFFAPTDVRHNGIFVRGGRFFNTGECLDRILNTGNFATFFPTWVAHNYINVNNAHSTVCPLNDDDDDYILYFITTYVQKGSFFLESLNKFITFYLESGIDGKLLINTLDDTRPTRNTVDVSDGYFVFTLNHLNFAFYIIFLGHSLSFLVFVCEVLYKLRLRYF